MVLIVWTRHALNGINDIDQRIAGGTGEVRVTNYLLQRFCWEANYALRLEEAPSLVD
jgi:hypothetical protein